MDIYRRRVLRHGDTHKDRVLSEMRASFSTHLKESPASHEILVDNEPYTVLVADRRFADEELNGKYVFTKWDDELRLGAYVKALGSTWFIDLVEEETVEAKRAYRIHPVNNTLKWQNKQGQIFEYPCWAIDKTSVYSDGMSKGTVITTHTYQAQILIPRNKYVDMIDTNDRFIFNHSKHNIYYVTRIDTLSIPNLVYITMKRDELTIHEDDLENNLSKPIGINAILDDNIVTDENPKDEIEYIHHEIIGSEKINVRQKDVEYKVPTSNEVVWELIGSIASMRTENNSVYISPTGGYGTVTLKAIIGDEVIEKKISIGFM